MLFPFPRAGTQDSCPQTLLLSGLGHLVVLLMVKMGTNPLLPPGVGAVPAKVVEGGGYRAAHFCCESCLRLPRMETGTESAGSCTLSSQTLWLWHMHHPPRLL